MHAESNVIPLVTQNFVAPVLGNTLSTGLEVPIDVERLLATRLFIQAMSGGGKSYVLRRILEQTFGMVQQIVIDIEGELVTLADKFDYLVCASDSEEAPITPRSGAAVARAIFMSGRSAILNLSDFEIEDSQQFVADFVRQLMRMPKSTWHHVLVTIDEVQVFAPQQDKAESKKPMIDLSGRGRKRGLCLAAATQRISLVSKGVVANLDNKMIGLTTLAIDVEKVADQLGMRLREAKLALNELKLGQFLVYGPALSTYIEHVSIGPVQTRHGSLAKFTGVVTPSISKEELAAQLFAAANPQKADSPLQCDVDDPQLYPRYLAIKPLLIDEHPTGAAVAARAEVLGVSAASLYNWIRLFRMTNDPTSIDSGRKNHRLVSMLQELANCPEAQDE